MDITPKPRLTRINERWTNQLWHGRWAHHRWEITLTLAEGGFVEAIRASCTLSIPGAPPMVGQADEKVGPFDELREIVGAVVIASALACGEQQRLPGV